MFPCGEDLTEFLGEAFNSSLPEWKRLVVFRFKEIGYGDVDALIKDEKFNGKCCRLAQLVSVSINNIDRTWVKTGVDCIILCCPEHRLDAHQT